MDTNKSNLKSKSTINAFMEKGAVVTNALGITNKPLNKSKTNQLIEKINHPLRKVAHACEYLVFTLLIMVALNNSNIEGKKVFLIALIICFIYSCTDEFHQIFVNGRTGQFIDCIIDTLGGLIGCLIIIIKNKILAIVNKVNLD